MNKPGRDLISLKKLVIEKHVHWNSEKSVRRAIQNEHFPYYFVSNHYLFDLEEVRLWYKKREIRAS